MKLWGWISYLSLYIKEIEQRSCVLIMKFSPSPYFEHGYWGFLVLPVSWSCICGSAGVESQIGPSLGFLQGRSLPLHK